MNDRLPRSVREFTQMYIAALYKYLSEDLIEGIYLYGSISLGAFNEERSDIDFIVLLKRPVDEKEMESIKEVHSQMRNYEFGNRMDGVYVQVNLLGKTNDELPSYPFCAEGKVSSGHWDVNHITWWILKNHGIILHGTQISELNIPTQWEDVLKTLEYNINQYWFRHTENVNNFLPDEIVEFTCTTICRIICSLEQQDILSKDRAVIECLNTLPERWHLLLEEGARIRTENNTNSLYESNVKRAEACREFVLYAHQLCNENFF